MATVLTDADVNALQTTDVVSREDQVQGAKFFPIVVDLSTAGITIGRALLVALNGTAALAAALGVTAVTTKKEEEAFLRSITYLAIIPPVGSPLDILAYAAAGTHLVTAPAGLVYYEPTVEVWRNYVANGVAATLIRLGVGS